MNDLWPDTLVGSDRPKAPVAVLREQASLLGDKTNNIVIAQVHSLKRSAKSRDLPWTVPSESEEEFRYVFYLVAPALDNYTYRLFTIGNSIELYPVNVYWHAEEQAIRADNQEGLEEVLRTIFSSGRTQQLITAMLVQSEDREEELPF